MHGGPHLSDDSAHRHAALLSMLIDLRMENDVLRHDLNAVHSRATWFEDQLKEKGWRVTTPRESPTPKLVRIDEEGEVEWQ